MSVQGKASRLTLRKIQALKEKGEPIAMLTAYDTVTARLVEEGGAELILVGDSLGNVILGFDTTLPVRLEDMIRHTAAVVRGTERALVILDLPFGTTTSVENAVAASVRAFQESGCQAVKLEGGSRMAPIVRKLTEEGMPVMGHIGLTPQSVHQLGGYYRHGKTESDAERLLREALALEEAGAFAVVLECLMPEVAAAITKTLKIPTIGIGSGPVCSGQVLVINDLIGLSTRPAPSFAQPRADVASVIRQAVASYVQDTKAGETSWRAGSSSTSATRTQ